MEALVSAESADVLCLQEHKLQDGKHCDEAAEALESHFPGWKVHWNCSTARKGYSGTAFICKEPPLSVECGIGHVDHDAEGRVLTAEFPTCFLVNVYVPNSGAELKRLDYRIKEWDVAFSEYLKGLEARGKPVVVTGECCPKGVYSTVSQLKWRQKSSFLGSFTVNYFVIAGDLNCAAEPIDIHDPKHNLKSAGFTPEERESFAERFLGKGLVDAFRRLHPGVVGYTYW